MLSLTRLVDGDDVYVSVKSRNGEHVSKMLDFFDGMRDFRVERTSNRIFYQGNPSFKALHHALLSGRYDGSFRCGELVIQKPELKMYSVDFDIEGKESDSEEESSFEEEDDFDY